ncbi:MAG: S-adenosyl-l-methionine hydroxide adenosyltransferase family protein [Chitinophagaceae bacterium]
MRVILLRFVVAFAFIAVVATGAAQSKIVVFQSDFGVKDGAVSAMKGVAMGVSSDLKLYDLTHEIPAYDIWQGAYRLMQTVPYWPAGTVFVSVIDPGVGTDRKSVVAKTKTGQYIVTPDNGTLTLIAETLGIAEVREIDEAVNRRKDSEKSYTFHGRDVYAYTGARLASGVITYEQVGKALPDTVVMIKYQKAVAEGSKIKGNIPVLDVQYGNVWTNISVDLVKQLNLKPANSLLVTIYNNNKKVYQGRMPYVETFGAVGKGKPLAYLNSLLQLSFALNQQSFASVYHVDSGSGWSVEVTK